MAVAQAGGSDEVARSLSIMLYLPWPAKDDPSALSRTVAASDVLEYTADVFAARMSIFCVSDWLVAL